MKSFLALILSFFQLISFNVIRIGKTRTIGVNRYVTYQTFESFGTSAAWWAQNVEDEETAEEIARLLYDKETGLGLEVFRYNVGAGEKENPDSRISIESRKAESFAVYDKETGSFKYDFSRDSNARRVLDYAVKYGADKVILFSNSPHYALTVSGQASGGLESHKNNLPEENYGAYVDYMLTVADKFVEMGYPVFGISPINEPQWSWGGERVTQEGCHFDADECIKLLELFAQTMKERNVSYRLLGPESGQLSEDQYEYIDKFMRSQILRDYCEYFSGHSYWMDNNYDGKTATGQKFADEYPDMKFEMSEWCELPLKIDSTTVDSALYMANIIIQDLTLLNAVSWQSWTAVNEDGLLNFTDEGLVKYMRYYAFMHFSRFIKPGAVRIDTMDSGDNRDIQSVAFDCGGRTVMVIVNNSDSDIKLKTSGLRGSYEIYRTDEVKRCEQVEEGSRLGPHTIPAKSIETIVVG